MSNDSLSDKLVPGTTIEHIEGEILSIKMSQWGVIGKLRTDFGIVDYKLKEPEMAKRILVGMNLEISNGFTVKSKNNDIIVTDGKFGKASVGIKLRDHYHFDNNLEKLLTGTVRDINQTSDNLEIEIELSYPPQIMRSFSIPLQEANNENKIKQTLENSVNKIVRIEVNNNQESAICSIEILTEDHLWYKFKELKSGKLEDVTYFSQLILKQKEIIEEYIRTFTELLFNLGKNLSKTTLTALRSLLNSKIYNAEVEFPYTLLISDNEISTYLDSMLEFSRSFIYGSNIVQDPDDLLELIGNFFLPYKMKVNNS